MIASILVTASILVLCVAVLLLARSQQQQSLQLARQLDPWKRCSLVAGQAKLYQQGKIQVSVFVDVGLADVSVIVCSLEEQTKTWNQNTGYRYSLQQPPATLILDPPTSSLTGGFLILLVPAFR